MADVSITPANVLASSTATLDKTKVAGATITAGEPVSLNASNQWVPCANGTTLLLATAKGFALNGASSGQPVAVVTADTNYTPGFTGTIGETVWTSANAGGVTVTASDNGTTGQYIGILGVMTSTTTMIVNPTICTAAHA